jgi:hypothetical protein
LFVFVFAFAATALAQAPTGSITGTVLDPTGLPVAGADVVIINQNTNTPYRTRTSSQGSFLVTTLPPGQYRLEIESEGFKKHIVTNIEINVGTQYSVPPVNLELGVIAETVTVEAGAEIVKLADAQVSNVVALRQIEGLPYSDRDPLDLLDLQAGTTGTVVGTGADRVINGLRTSFTNVTYEGINIQDNFIRTGSNDFSPILPLSSQVSECAPSGINDWHGEVFWQHRNNKVAANDWFANRRGTEKPKLILNQGGVNGGGPIVKDKLFAYGWWELYRLAAQDPQVENVLTPSARNGIFTFNATCGGATTPACPGGITNGQQQTLDLLAFTGLTVDPFVAGLLSRVPTEVNDTSVGDGLNYGGFGFNQDQSRERKNYGFKIDWLPTEKHSIFGTWAWNRDEILRPDADETFNETPVVTNDGKVKFLSLGWRWSPSGRFTNEARGGFTLAPALFASSEDFGDFAICSDFNCTQGVGTGTFLFTSPVTDFRAQGRLTDTWSVADNATYVWGSHTMKFGGSFQKVMVDPTFSSFDVPPTYEIGMSAANPFTLIPADFTALGGVSGAGRDVANQLLASLAGFVEAATAEFNVTSPDSGFVQGAVNARRYDLDTWSFYFNDTWRVRPNLTFTYGVRWEYFTPFSEKDGLRLTPVLASETRAAMNDMLVNSDLSQVIDFAGDVVGRPHYDDDYNNFSPQVGLVWDPWGDGRTAIRAGYSMNYVNDEFMTSGNNSTQMDGLNASTTLDALFASISGGNAPMVPTFTAPPFKVPRTMQDQMDDGFGAFGVPDTPATLFTIDPELKTPYVQQWNLSLQREIGWDTAVEVRYMGHHSVHLYRALDYNQVNINAAGFLDDFLRARSNGFICEAAGLGFDAFCAEPGSVPLQLFPTLPFNGFLGPPFSIVFGGFFENLVRAGEPGEFLSYYQWNLLPAVGVPSALPYGGITWAANPWSGISDALLNWSRSKYHAGVIEFRRRPTEGLFFQANYTWSKSTTDSSGCRANACNSGQSRFDPVLDINNLDYEWNRSDFDITHAFKGNFVYDLPMGSGKAWASDSGAVNKLIGGWQIGSIFTWQSGTPFSILSNRGTLNRFGRSNTRNTATSLAGGDAVDGLLGLHFDSDGVLFIDPAAINTANFDTGVNDDALTCNPFGPGQICHPAPGTVGNLPRNAFNAPEFFNWDLSISKRTEITETIAVVFGAEFLNFLNHPTFFIGPNQSIDSSSFMRSIDTVSNRRRIQFNLRVTF